ncbi:MAG: PHP domain-containing protein [Candidatus Pacebacteria bacterium]|nr:PHP domain-containing protein [Candidatus Paceibacterota bacterium]
MKYSGIIHAHSRYSYDGKLMLPELKEVLQKRGMRFICLTEHTDKLTPEAADSFVKECRALSDEKFIFVPGFEVPYLRAHVLMFGATKFVSNFADATQLKEWAAGASFVVLAHPQRNKFIVDDVLESVLDGVEVWNQQYDGKLVPRWRSLQLLYTLRRRKPGLVATGGLDFHRIEHLGAPVVTLELSTLTEANILAALKSGALTFGTTNVTVPGTGEWREGKTFSFKIRSIASTTFIWFGKKVNATLAAFGFKLPKKLKEAIRSKI